MHIDHNGAMWDMFTVSADIGLITEAPKLGDPKMAHMPSTLVKKSGSLNKEMDDAVVTNYNNGLITALMGATTNKTSINGSMAFDDAMACKIIWDNADKGSIIKSTKSIGVLVHELRIVANRYGIGRKQLAVRYAAATEA